jgi:hypothetical protein
MPDQKISSGDMSTNGNQFFESRRTGIDRESPPLLVILAAGGQEVNNDITVGGIDHRPISSK